MPLLQVTIALCSRAWIAGGISQNYIVWRLRGSTESNTPSYTYAPCSLFLSGVNRERERERLCILINCQVTHLSSNWTCSTNCITLTMHELVLIVPFQCSVNYRTLTQQCTAMPWQKVQAERAMHTFRRMAKHDTIRPTTTMKQTSQKSHHVSHLCIFHTIQYWTHPEIYHAGPIMHINTCQLCTS